MIRRLLAFFGIVEGGAEPADDDEPVGYDGFGAPIYRHQED